MRILICASLVLSFAACDHAQPHPEPAVTVDPGPAPIADVIQRPTTDGELALKNLDAQIGVALDLLEQTPDRPELATQAIGLMLARIQYTGNYADFGLIDRLSAQLTETHAALPDAWLTRADFLSATHRFTQAHAAVDRAEALGAPLQDERRATYWLATGNSRGYKASERRHFSRARPTRRSRIWPRSVRLKAPSKKRMRCTYAP